MHHTPLAVAGGRGGGANYSSAAVVHNTPPTISSIWAAPGRYTVKLTANGQSYTQPLTLKLDPRVKTPALGLAQQFTLSKQLYDGIIEAQQTVGDIRARLAVASNDPARSSEVAALQALEGQAAGRGAAADGPDTFNSVIGAMNQLRGLLQGADVTPTTQLTAAVAGRRAAVANLKARWNALKAAK